MIKYIWSCVYWSKMMSDKDKIEDSKNEKKLDGNRLDVDSKNIIEKDIKSSDDKIKIDHKIDHKKDSNQENDTIFKKNHTKENSSAKHDFAKDSLKDSYIENKKVENRKVESSSEIKLDPTKDEEKELKTTSHIEELKNVDEKGAYDTRDGKIYSKGFLYKLEECFCNKFLKFFIYQISSIAITILIAIILLPHIGKHLFPEIQEIPILKESIAKMEVDLKKTNEEVKGAGKNIDSMISDFNNYQKQLDDIKKEFQVIDQKFASNKLLENVTGPSPENLIQHNWKRIQDLFKTGVNFEQELKEISPYIDENLRSLSQALIPYTNKNLKTFPKLIANLRQIRQDIKGESAVGGLKDFFNYFVEKIGDMVNIKKEDEKEVTEKEVRVEKVVDSKKLSRMESILKRSINFMEKKNYSEGIKTIKNNLQELPKQLEEWVQTAELREKFNEKFKEFQNKIKTFIEKE